MKYYLTKANPNKWRLQDYLRSLGTDVPFWWSEVCEDAEPGDILYIGLSGDKAGIYGKATITSDPNPDTPDQEYAVPPGSAKERLGANIDSFHNLVDHPILEATLRRRSLERVADWLHIQGAVCHLEHEEAEAICRLIESSNAS